MRPKPKSRPQGPSRPSHNILDSQVVDLVKVENEKSDCVSYKKLEALAQKILAKNPNATEVLDKLRQLKAEQDEMEDLWEKRNKELTDAKDLQVGVSLVK